MNFDPQAWDQAVRRHAASMRPRRSLGGDRARALVVGAGLLAVLAAPAALAVGEGRPLDGGTRNPSANQELEYARETEIIADTSSYGTRQSNKSSNGGGAIYGCRSGAGGTTAGNEPCLRGSNLSSGRAFEFATDGDLGGAIEVGRGGDGAKPFTTNATGVATGLNADRVDGLSAAEIVAAAGGSGGGGGGGTPAPITLNDLTVEKRHFQLPSGGQAVPAHSCVQHQIGRPPGSTTVAFPVVTDPSPAYLMLRSQIVPGGGTSSRSIQICNIDDEAHTLTDLEFDLYLLRP